MSIEKSLLDKFLKLPVERQKEVLDFNRRYALTCSATDHED
jgi:hypothetical protein